MADKRQAPVRFGSRVLVG